MVISRSLSLLEEEVHLIALNFCYQPGDFSGQKKVKTLHNVEKKALNKKETVEVKRRFIPFGISVRGK